MGNKRNRKRKADRKRDDDDNREKQKLRYIAKKQRVAETEERTIEDINTDLHDNVEEMEIENRVQEEQIEVEKNIVEDVNSDLHANVDEINIEDQVQNPEIEPGMYISYIFQIYFFIMNFIF